MKVGFAQTSPRFGDREGNFKRLEELLDPIEADLVVLPELFATGYLFENRNEAIGYAEDVEGSITLEFILEMAKRKKCWVVAGFAEKAGDELFNSAAVVSPARTEAIYRKVHLFDREKEIFDPGQDGFRVVEGPGSRLGVMVCFDWIFPESARSLAILGADIICHPANLVLPYCQNAMVTRCVENRVFAVTANRIGQEVRAGRDLTFTGLSQVVDPSGEILARAGTLDEECRIVEIDTNLAKDKMVTDSNDVLGDRRPELYVLGSLEERSDQKD
jgi:predicted amidohydrolase